MKTFMQKKETVQRDWLIIDAAGQTLGRLASEVASILKGKYKPTYTPNVDCGDYVIIINADKIELTGKKLDRKIYIRHTGHIGGLKKTTAKDLRAKNPVKMIELAVFGMLPKNTLGEQMRKKLFVYTGSEHPHQAQQPKQYELRG